MAVCVLSQNDCTDIPPDEPQSFCDRKDSWYFSS